MTLLLSPSSIPWKRRRQRQRTTAVSSVLTTVTILAIGSSSFWLNSHSRHYGFPVASAFTIHASFASGPTTATTGGTPPTSTLITTTRTTTTTNLLDDYDAFILDQFGVLHNGKAALPGAHALIAELLRRKKPLIILSNTSSPAHATLARLHTTLHFPAPHQFLTAITSGEEAIHYIQHTYTNTNTNTNTHTKTHEEEEEEKTGTTTAEASSRNRNRNRNRICKFIWFTWDTQTNTNVPDPMQFIHHLNNPKTKNKKNNQDDDDDDDDDDGSTVIFEPTLDIEAAEFVVAHGCNVIRGSRSGDDTCTTNDTHVQSVGNFLVDGQFTNGIDTILAQCAQRHLPLICANPDVVVKYHDGTLKQMPGQIAHRYSTKFHMSHHTKLFGKPHPEHFEACLHALYQHQQNQNEDNEDRNNNKDATTPASSSAPPLSTPVLRIAHVGDSIQHDVAGANAVAGIDSIFIMGGIHSDVFEETTTTTTTTTTTITATAGVDDETTKRILSDRIRLQNFFEHEGHTPTHVVPMFRL